MMNQVKTSHRLRARLTTPIPAGWDALAYAEHLKQLGNPVVRALPEEGVVLLAELESQPEKGS